VQESKLASKQLEGLYVEHSTPFKKLASLLTYCAGILRVGEPAERHDFFLGIVSECLVVLVHLLVDFRRPTCEEERDST
jgi:hypothetical protein